MVNDRIIYAWYNLAVLWATKLYTKIKVVYCNTNL